MSISIDAIENWGLAQADLDIQAYFQERADYAVAHFTEQTAL
jgi:hypothetical protein